MYSITRMTSVARRYYFAILPSTVRWGIERFDPR
jgi:hypothetical protein